MTDTIVALATPPGSSGLAVVRLSGSNAFKIGDKCFFGKIKLKNAASHTIHFGKFYDGEILIDTVTALVFCEPHSSTGENVVEFCCHGGVLLYNQIIETLIKNGARQAQPGEFTKRAFLNGKLDLTQVEAVADLISATSLVGSHTSARQLLGGFTEMLSRLRQNLLDSASLLELELDFADEDIDFINKDALKEKILQTKSRCDELAAAFKRSEILRSGFFVGIAGFPNSGKSTLFNALLQRERAIVSEKPGTTRDYLEERIILDGTKIHIIDTAGIRSTQDEIEIEGIRLADSALRQSNLIIVLNDASVSLNHSDNLYRMLAEQYPDTEMLLVHNKIDLIDQNSLENFEQNASCISAKKKLGIDKLKAKISEIVSPNIERINDVLINQRHAQLLRQASDDLQSALNAIESGMDNEIIAIDIRSAIRHFGEITGEVSSEDILNNIFSRFCVGK
jgi:tRNA modification GTPase